MTSYVLDATVAAKWFLPAREEPLSSEALSLLRDFGGGRTALLVPDLFWPEFGNILWKAVRQGRIGRALARESIERVRELGIATAACEPLLPSAFAIATGQSCTVYDGVYIALAVLSGKPLVTADERLVNALATRFPVRWLATL